MGKGLPFAIFLLFLLPLAVFPEGTRQIAPASSAVGWLCLDKSRNDFGFFDAAPEFRINISIARTTESINFGIGQNMYLLQPVDILYRLRDPAGNIVAGPALVPLTGKGFISSWDSAVKGPFPGAGGYDPIRYNPLTTGDYYLEFSYQPDSSGYFTESGRVMFTYFDVTVLDAAQKPVNGRVWSKAWQFNCGNVMAPPTNNRFWGTMYILSDDSVVTSVNCNGFVGGTFSIASNRTGCSTTGNVNVDRQSRTGFHTYPQYKVFLNDPDSTIFPTGTAKPGIILPITSQTDCATGSAAIGVKVDMDGFIEVFIEVNPHPGIDPQDLVINAAVLANPGGNGYNQIIWNGLDGLGNKVRNGTTVSATVKYIHGITHLPIYDIEYNDSGYIVQEVRPTGNTPLIYWDDRLVPGNSTYDLTGCANFFGCHLWDYDIGNNNTINSWWYVVSATAPSISFTLKRTPLDPGAISGPSTVCAGDQTRDYSVVADSNATVYQWSYSGTGATITGNTNKVSIAFTAGATPGILTVTGSNPDCGQGPSSNLQVAMLQPPVVKLAAFDTTCYTATAFQLTGGTPPGGEYLVNGKPVSLFDPASAGPGQHRIVYRYTDVNGCTGSDSTLLFLQNGHECEIMIWVPNAFSPNGDGLNDLFQPRMANVREMTMAIYDRNGQLVYSTNDLKGGWDGRSNGQLCPTGTYAYLIVYESSLSPPAFKKISGYVTLVR